MRFMNQNAFQTLVRAHLAESQIRNPSYSIRAFAKRLGLGFGTVSQVLAGKRELAPKSVEKVLNRLGTGPAERSKIFKTQKQKLSYELKADEYFILSEWHYLAILSLIRTRDFKSTAEHVSERLGISLTLAKQAIERLERTRLIRFEKGKILRTSVAISTTDGTPDAAIKKSHYQSLDRARLSLDEHPLEARDMTWLTFAFAPKDMEAAKQKIREFQDEFADQFSTSKEATEVYRLAMQLFSLTEPKHQLGKQTKIENKNGEEK